MTKLAVGMFVSVSYQGSWYPAKVVELRGEAVVVRRTQGKGSVPQILSVSEDEVRVITEKNFGNY